MMEAILVSNGQRAVELATKLLQSRDPVGFDTESDGPLLASGKMINVYRSRLVGFSVAFSNGKSYYVPVAHQKNNVSLKLVDKILSALWSNGRDVWAHNWKHDALVLKLHGAKVEWSQCRDSMVSMWLAQLPAASGGYGLKGLTETHLGRKPPSFQETLGKQASFSTLSPRAALEYAAADALNTLELGILSSSCLQERELSSLFIETEMPFVEVLSHMETTGMALDRVGLHALADKMREALQKIVDDWEFVMPDVSITSTKQIREAMYDTKLWSTKGILKTAKGLPKVDRESLETHLARHQPGTVAHEVASLKLAYQGISKYLTTYTLNLIEDADQYPDERLHPSFHHTGTATGRLSCSKPNLQNIPVRTELGMEVKKCFVPRDGYVFVAADYSQVELRVLAHFAGDGALAEAYRNNADIHQQTADLVGSTRNQAKTINFATVYGAGAKKLARTLGVSDERAAKFLNDYFKAYPEVRSIKRRIVRAADSRGYIRTISGRRRYIPELRQRGSMRWRGERLAFNTPIQGGAADIVKLAMLRLFRKLKEDGRLNDDVFIVGQVHDEITLEVFDSDDVIYYAEKTLQWAMETAVNLTVPLIAEPSTGKTWGDCK